MTHLLARFGMNVLLCSIAICAGAAQSEQALTPITGAQGVGLQNRLRFVTGEEAKEYAEQMKARLLDPAQRAALRAEQRASVVSQNTGVGRAIGIDTTLEQRLIELLTDQQMARLDQMHLQARPSIPSLQTYADETTQRMDALADLLGEDALARYQDFERCQTARYWVGQFANRLAPQDRLQPEQFDRLTALKQEQFDKLSATMGPWRMFRRSAGQSVSMDQIQRESQQQARIANENSWRIRQAEHRAIEQKAAAFLTSAQLAELAKYQAQEQEELRRYAEAARREAGLDPKIPEQPEALPSAPRSVDAQVQIEVKLTVNGEPTTVTRTVRSGEAFTFDAAQGLIAEATPTVFDDGWMDVHLKFLEHSATGQRRLTGGTISTIQALPLNGTRTQGGGGGTVINGRKGYAVETTIQAQVL